MEESVMTPKEFAETMAYFREQQKEQNDMEQSHFCMDNLMASVLESLGYGEGVDIFKNTPKWYA